MTKEDGTRIHGVTLIYYELVEDPKILAAMSTLQKMHDLQQICSAAQRGEREPTSRSKSKTLEPLYAQKAITIISQFPAVAIFEAYLRQLYSAVQKNDGGALPLECFVSNLLFEVPAPRPGKAVRFQCTEPLRLAMPTPENPRMCQYSFMRLFNIFSVDTVLIIYSIILLEEQVVFRSNDLSLLSLVAECFVLQEQRERRSQDSLFKAEPHPRTRFASAGAQEGHPSHKADVTKAFHAAALSTPVHGSI